MMGANAKLVELESAMPKKSAFRRMDAFILVFLPFIQLVKNILTDETRDLLFGDERCCFRR